VFKPFFEVYPFLWKWDIKKQKTEKRVAKTIKCIYFEPGILILLRMSFDFWVNKFFQIALNQRTTISSLPPKEKPHG